MLKKTKYSVVLVISTFVAVGGGVYVYNAQAANSKIVSNEALEPKAIAAFLDRNPTKFEVENFLGDTPTEVISALYNSISYRYDKNAIENDTAVEAGYDFVDFETIDDNVITFCYYDDYDVISSYTIYFKDKDEVTELRYGRGKTTIALAD